jgi:hypothetical protein
MNASDDHSFNASPRNTFPQYLRLRNFFLVLPRRFPRVGGGSRLGPSAFLAFAFTSSPALET